MPHVLEDGMVVLGWLVRERGAEIVGSGGVDERQTQRVEERQHIASRVGDPWGVSSRKSRRPRSCGRG